MSERVICYRHVAGSHKAYQPDPDAPSVSEVVEVLREYRDLHPQFRWRTKVDKLISRLEE